MNKQLRNILINIAGCIVFLSVPFLFSPDLNDPARIFSIPPFQRDFIGACLILICFYLNYYLLIPKLYFAREYFIFFGIALLSFVVIVVVPHVLIQGGPPQNSHGNPPPRMEPYMGFHYVMAVTKNLFQFIFMLFLALVIKINERWKQAEKERLNTELSYLKAQINPHFLFNTLNSIYALALEKSDETANSVVKLSGMMRYVLSESDKDKVSLDKEISYVSDYIELQKLRLNNTVDLQFELKGIVNGKRIAPLILIPFIENTFKHGVNPEQNSSIHIEIEIKDKELVLTTKNKKVGNLNLTESIGVGIPNTRQRLTMVYPGKHTLRIDETKTEFSVYLRIDLE